MSKSISEVYVQASSVEGAERVLHPGRLLAVGSDRYHADFGEEAVDVDPERNLLLCYEHDRRFVKEPVRVVGFERVGQRVLVELEVVGDSISAESRSSCRLKTERANLFCRFDGEDNCPVINISHTGFALYAGRQHRIGQRIDAQLHHRGEVVTGVVSIRNARQLDTQWIRYGVQCGEEDNPLRIALPRIKLALQREP